MLLGLIKEVDHNYSNLLEEGILDDESNDVAWPSLDPLTTLLATTNFQIRRQLFTKSEDVCNNSYPDEQVVSVPC